MHRPVSTVRHIQTSYLLCVCRRYTSAGFQYSYDQIPTAEAMAAMLEKSPITHAAQVRHTQTLNTVFYGLSLNRTYFYLSIYEAALMLTLVRLEFGMLIRLSTLKGDNKVMGSFVGFPSTYS